ncbi:putative oxidoreductase [Pelagibacter phage Lederberg EXVC029P]|nr:putative oxidoreductase [Pelagibacter phage Lederberg EXVC029P]
MARYTYAFSNGVYNDWHRKYDGIAMIDIDSVECCAKCYEPLAIIETCYDKGQAYKVTTLSKIIAKRLNIPCFLVFYKKLDNDTLTFRIKRIRSSQTDFKLMNEREWVDVLLSLHDHHRKECKK